MGAGAPHTEVDKSPSDTADEAIEKEQGETGMADRNLTVAIIGAGAIGGTTAAFLAQAGWDVELVCKHPETVALASTSGLHVFGVRGEHRVKVKSVREIGELARGKDVVLLATKATECLAAARALLPMIREDTSVVSLQNGICEDALAGVLGRERVLGCVVGWGASMHGPAELEVTSEGEFVIGAMDGRPDSRLPVLKHMLDAVAPTRISDNIMGELYSKLIINSCINSLGVITGQRLGELLADAKVRHIFIGLMQEAMAVAQAMEIKVEPGGGGKLNYYSFLASTSILARIRRHLMIRLIGFKYRRIRSSSLQSLERGRKTEIDYLNGYICERGQERGVSTPLNQAVVTMVKEIENHARKITPENLKDSRFEA
jgi:2-dehydropantoate 2-reductase